MKITCQSCQSKYNVADDKVQGKIVKIRCRKCGATIVVDGSAAAATNGSAGAAEAPPPVSAKSVGTDEWHVNVAENDQRTMALSELVAAYNSGTVTVDTFVWAEGMGDWKPLGEVEAILTALHDHAEHPAPAPPREPQAPPLQTPSPQEDEPTRAFTANAAAPYGSLAGANFGSGDVGGRAEPKRAAVKREGRGRDLFATGLSAAEVHGGQDTQESVQTSAPLMQPGAMAAAEDPNKLTGERNENSVLFSLAVLTKTAEERAPAASDVTSSSREDSGLIDLKALAAKTESMRPAIMADGAVFSAPLGTMPALGAPLGALDAPLGEAARKSKLPRVIGAVAGVALALILAFVIGAKFAGGSGAASTAASASAASAPSASPPPDTAAAAATAAPSDSAAAAAAAASVTAAASKPKVNGGGGGGVAWHPPAGATKPASAAATPAAAGGGPAAAPAAAPAKKSDCGCNGDLMCLMKCSTH